MLTGTAVHDPISIPLDKCLWTALKNTLKCQLNGVKFEGKMNDNNNNNKKVEEHGRKFNDKVEQHVTTDAA